MNGQPGGWGAVEGEVEEGITEREIERLLSRLGQGVTGKGRFKTPESIKKPMIFAARSEGKRRRKSDQVRVTNRETVGAKCLERTNRILC